MATTHTNGHESSRAVHQQINRIREDMDHTLSEIGTYLHPKHMLDYVVDSVRSQPSGASKQKIREAIEEGAQALKRHPGPALLLGGAALWYFLEHGSSDPFRKNRGKLRRAATYGAWEEAYDWSTAPEDEPTWSERARGALDEVRTVIADTTLAGKDKVRAVANTMIGASGKTREEIHAQWSDLQANSGSFVDARTGEPYDDSYGDDAACSSLEACARLSDDRQDDLSWSDKAQGAVSAMADSLKNTGASVKQQLQALGGHMAGLANDAGLAASRAASGSRRSAARGFHSAADGAKHGAQRVGGAVQHGYERGRDQFQRALHDQPLAVGAACLGLGLLAGMLAPATRRENELMGEAADRLKDQARGAGEEVVQRGQPAASAAVAAVSEAADRQRFTP